MTNNVTYYKTDDNMEYIYYHRSKQSYPMHTHANHVTFGCILDGAVCIICDGKKCLYHAGEHFCIMPDTPHALHTVNDTAYSMISICVSSELDISHSMFTCGKWASRCQAFIKKYNNKPHMSTTHWASHCHAFIEKLTSAQIQDKSEYESGCLKKIKQIISDAPEHVFFIEDMARSIGLSPFYMIRSFKAVCGLTPHQFQIQCRVRKAQKLLEQGKSVTEAAYATGFCDQSHFDRCFHKVVRLTPSEYKQSVKSLD